MLSASAVRSAKPPGDARAQVGFRAGAGDVHAALNQAIDERADDLGTVHPLAVPVAHVFREAVERMNLAVEEDDRHFGPWLTVDGRPAGAGFAVRVDRGACAWRSFSRWARHSAADYTWQFLLAQTQQ